MEPLQLRWKLKAVSSRCRHGPLCLQEFILLKLPDMGIFIKRLRSLKVSRIAVACNTILNGRSLQINPLYRGLDTLPTADDKQASTEPTAVAYVGLQYVALGWALDFAIASGLGSKASLKSATDA